MLSVGRERGMAHLRRFEDFRSATLTWIDKGQNGGVASDLVKDACSSRDCAAINAINVIARENLLRRAAIGRNPHDSPLRPSWNIVECNIEDPFPIRRSADKGIVAEGGSD